MSELKFCIRLSLFLSSFLPLWITLFIFNAFRNETGFLHDLSSFELTIAVFLLVLSIVPPLLVFLLLHKKRNNKAHVTTIIVKKHSNLTKEFLLYLVTYTIPFILHDNFDNLDFITVMIFMCAVGAIYLKSDMIFINPLFAFMNYKLHNVIDENNAQRYILTKKDVYEDDEIKSVMIDRYFYIEYNKKD